MIYFAENSISSIVLNFQRLVVIPNLWLNWYLREGIDCHVLWSHCDGSHTPWLVGAMVAFTDLDFSLSLYIKVFILIYFFGLSPAVGVDVLEKRKCTCLSQRANLSCWYQSSCESVSTCVSQSVGVPPIFFFFCSSSLYSSCTRAYLGMWVSLPLSWQFKMVDSLGGHFKMCYSQLPFWYSSSSLLSVLALGPTVIPNESTPVLV